MILEKWQKGLMFAYFFLLFVFTVVMYCIFAFNSMDQPILTLDQFYNDAFVAMFIIVAILSAIAILVIVFLYVKILCQCRTRNFMWRSTLFLAYSAFYIMIIFIILYTLPLAPHNYISRTEGLILVSYSYCNIYVYVLQYMYYTPRSSLNEAIARKNNAHEIQDSNTIVSGL